MGVRFVQSALLVKGRQWQSRPGLIGASRIIKNGGGRISANSSARRRARSEWVTPSAAHDAIAISDQIAADQCCEVGGALIAKND
jgi:hypothetical protein